MSVEPACNTANPPVRKPARERVGVVAGLPVAGSESNLLRFKGLNNSSRMLEPRTAVASSVVLTGTGIVVLEVSALASGEAVAQRVW